MASTPAATWPTKLVACLCGRKSERSRGGLETTRKVKKMQHRQITDGKTCYDYNRAGPMHGVKSVKVSLKIRSNSLRLAVSSLSTIYLMPTPITRAFLRLLRVSGSSKKSKHIFHNTGGHCLCRLFRVSMLFISETRRSYSKSSVWRFVHVRSYPSKWSRPGVSLRRSNGSRKFR
ncbi:hypothetical protein BKA81DRAFT_205433 [Phyllosticta paracitricarpa]